MIIKKSISKLITEYGPFDMVVFDTEHLKDNILLYKIGDGDPVLRVQSHCLTSTAFDSTQCDCDAQLKLGLRAIASSDFGILVYLNQEARGNGLHAKAKVLRHLNMGMSLGEAQIESGFGNDVRKYSSVMDILVDTDLPTSFHFLSTSKDKIDSLTAHGATILSVSEL